jgi:membrane protein DedA with SNARE-associated domain
MFAIETTLLSLAHTLPLELFVFFVSFLEEVIAPIPSPSVMVVAGSFGVIQGYTLSGFIFLVLLASVGKTLGGVTMYFIAWKLKDIGLRTFGRFIDITDDDIQKFKGSFTGTMRDYLLYIFFRSVPVIPSVILSFGSGVVRLPLRLFIIGTFVGTIVRDSFYIVVGYMGTEALRVHLRSVSTTESVILYLLVGACGLGVLYLLIRKQRRKLVASKSK